MTRTLFTNANLLDGAEAAKPGQTIAVEGGLITGVSGDGGSPRPGDTVFDLAGDTLMPGMIQSHWHGSYQGLDFEPPPVGLEKPPGYLMLLALKNAQLALSHGFTSVIGASVGDAIDAQLKWAIADGVVEGPRIVPCGRWLITTGDANDFPEFWWWGITARGGQEICDGPDEFRRAVRQEIKEGAEIIKIFADAGHALIYGKKHVSMSQDEIDSVVRTTHERGKQVRSHVDTKKGILNAIKSGIDLLDHADEMDEECIDAIVESGTFVCPSMYFPGQVLARFVRDGKGWEKSPAAIEMQKRPGPHVARPALCRQEGREIPDRRRLGHVDDAARRLYQGAGAVRKVRRAGAGRHPLGDQERGGVHADRQSGRDRAGQHRRYPGGPRRPQQKYLGAGRPRQYSGHHERREIRQADGLSRRRRAFTSPR